MVDRWALPFLEQYRCLTSLIQNIIPDINHHSFAENATDTSIKPNNEVFSGLPTAFNCTRLIESIKTCVNNLVNVPSAASQPVRSLLTQMELVSILCSTYNILDLECRMWDFMFQFSEESGRFLDASYAVVNCLLARLLFDETCANLDFAGLKDNARILNDNLSKHKHLLDASYEAAVSGQLLTPHAHLQSVLISLGVAYISCYSDLSAFNAQTDLIPLRYASFFAGKSWAAVCARGYFYWFRLHARCMFGATDEVFSVPTSREEFQTDYTSSVAPLPHSLLHAAVIVRMHGRTVVQFMRQSCEQKLAKQQLISRVQVEARKGDGSLPTPDVVPTSSSEVTAWGNPLLTDSELLNLWLGTRLLIRGCLQVTELYTLLGSVREARAYQDELLRISQRFHLVSCAQLALSLMAHLDLFAQRKWAFELRLHQLNHIATCTVPLEDVVRGLSCSSRKVKGVTSSKEEEAAFLQSNTMESIAARYQAAAQTSESTFDEVATDALSSAANPLISANSHGFTSMFPCSPTRTERYTFATPRCFPTPMQLVCFITGNVHIPCKELPKRSQTNSHIDAARKLDEVLSSVGGLPLTICTSRILNGANWPWLLKIIHLVRENLLSASHYFSVTLPPLSSKTTKQESECNGINDLLESFAALHTDPSPSTNESLVHPTQVKHSSLDPVSHTDSGQLPQAVPSTGVTMPPPPPSLNAPRRFADRRTSPCSRSTLDGRSRRRKPNIESADTLRIEVPLAAPSSAVPSTPVNVRRPPLNRVPNPMLDLEADDEAFPDTLGYQLAPRRQRVRQPKAINFYVDPNESYHSSDRHCKRFSVADKQGVCESNPLYDPVETCPSLASVPHRPRNLRLASRWEALQHRSAPQPVESVSPEFLASELRAAELKTSVDQLAARLDTAYNQLAGLPIPTLVRPICQWLGLWWLGKGDQNQAGRYFSQSVGIAPTSLYLSILSSRLSESKTTCSTVPNSQQLDGWFHAYCRIRECSIPHHPLPHQSHPEDSAPSSLITVIQLSLIDELVVSPSLYASSSDPSVVDPSHHVPLGLGAKTCAHLVATKFTGISGTTCANLRAESRVIHGFSSGGLKALNEFKQLQSESLDSMQIQDRVRYWKTRYTLDSRLESLLAEMQKEWFTQSDLFWLLNQNTGSASSIVLVLDRQLVYLPWEWILMSNDSNSDKMPLITRSFSLPLVLAHLATTKLATQPHTFPVFDPHSSYYVLNPEANLSFTQHMFQPLFQRIPTWHGVIGREPTNIEVDSGFTEHDLFIYLGHGNGSRFLLHPFNHGLASRAAALILGCSSGKPRWEGRHEPYSSLFNHLLAGCPFVAGLLWDVTDRDMDRFTWQLLARWLFINQDSKVNGASKSLAHCLMQASSACKLKHLVGRSVIVYGIPAEPIPDLLLSLPNDLRLECAPKIQRSSRTCSV